MASTADGEDEALTRAFMRDRERHFLAVYERYAKPLFRYVYRFTSSDIESEEILHDVFVQLLAGRFNASGEPHLKAWLYTVARNRALTREKKKRREEGNAELLERTADERNLESDIIQQDLQRRLAHAETKLPGDILETWRLRREGLDHAQIAARLSIPVGTVKSRFARLVALLRKEMERDIQS